MAGISSALTQKYGPLPGWAWAGALGIGAFFLLPRLTKTGTSTGAQNASAAGSQLSSGYGLGYAQGLQAAGPPTTPTATPKSRVVLTARPGYANNAVAVWSAPTIASSQLGQYPSGTTLDAGQVVQGGEWSGSSSWRQVTTPSGQTGYVWDPDAVALGTGGGRGGPVSIGSRSANLMHYAHPDIGARVPYTYHLRAVGGAPNHSREVYRVAQQAGVHPARIAMLNPEPTGFIRVA